MTSPVRGIDHVAMTVPNLDDASRFLEEALGAKPIELISHPSPGAYERETPLRRWTPPAV